MSRLRQSSRAEPCPICGRTDGDHDITQAEQKALRKIRWRAFRHGLTHPFGPPLGLDTMRRWRDEEMSIR